MTRIASTIAFVAVISFAVGCADNSPKPATKLSAKKKSEARTEGYVIIGDDDTPKPVNPSVKQGRSAISNKPQKPPAEPVKPAEPPIPEEPTFVVSGGFETTKEKAKESAIRAAVEKVHDYLFEQNPQVVKFPTTEMVRNMVIRHQGASEVDADIGKVTEQEIEVSGKPEKLYQVEVAVKVRPEHVRAMRSRVRSSEALWILAGLGGLAAVFGIFFKIDSWTKGYLTSWLVLGTVGAAALLGGMWWFAK
jgi:hypothetical protein